MPYYYYGYDPTYILVLIAFALSLFASFGVKHTYSKYEKIRSTRGYTAADVARAILDRNGLQHIRIERVGGNLTDHFDPRTNVVRLSDSTFSSSSVAAIGVAAHECGHAIQHATGYAPIKIRNSIVPVVNIGSTISMPLFIIGLFLGHYGLSLAGVLLFSLVLVFQLITLPVEFNASTRAIKILDGGNMLFDEELTGAKKVLTAAALTYVATALQLLRLLLILNRRRD